MGERSQAHADDPAAVRGRAAFAIGLLIGIGVQKAVVYDTPAPGAILLGVVTGAFGGAIADVLAGRQAAMLRERHWLLSAIVIGAVVFWLFTEYVAFYAAVVITVLIVVGLRVVSVRLDWTEPSFPGGDPPPESLTKSSTLGPSGRPEC